MNIAIKCYAEGGENAFHASDRLFTDPPVREPEGFVIPQTFMVRSEKEATEAADELGYPVALKGVVSHALPANSKAETRAAWSRRDC